MEQLGICREMNIILEVKDFYVYGLVFHYSRAASDALLLVEISFRKKVNWSDVVVRESIFRLLIAYLFYFF